jgi:N utilization substance protein A
LNGIYRFMSSPIEQAMRQICEEKGLAYESVLATIESALAAAYRKDFGDKYHNLEAEFDPETGNVRIFDVKTIVEDISPEELEEIRQKEAEATALREARRVAGEVIAEDLPAESGPVFNPKTDIMISDARVLKMSAQVGETLRRELPLPGEFGRMAAMTAKQVIMQKLREAEREIIFNEYKGIEGTVITGTVQRREGRVILVDIGRTAGILRPEDQMPTDRYRSGDRVQVYVREVSLGQRGAQILLSRTHEMLVQKLFETEIPEIGEGAVEIRALAREAGSRTKIAVSSRDPRIDPIGACIGQRGTRIQTVIAELSGEKIDIIEWNDSAEQFITQALAPAKIVSLGLDEEEHVATVRVMGDQLSLAIGRGGQNVRLAARLTGWKINILEEGAPLGGGNEERVAEEEQGESEPQEERPSVQEKEESSEGAE